SHCAGCISIAGSQFDFPDTLTAIAAVAFQDARTRPEPRWEFRTKCSRGGVQVGIRAPAKLPGAMQYLFDAHLHNDVVMCADPRTVRRDIAQHRIKPGSCLAFMDRIDPDQNAIDRK